jgi:parallel beta-helix repeat protein
MNHNRKNIFLIGLILVVLIIGFGLFVFFNSSIPAKVLEKENIIIERVENMQVKPSQLTGFVVSEPKSEDIVEEFDKTVDLEIKEAPERFGQTISDNKNVRMDFELQDGNLRLMFDMLDLDKFIEQSAIVLVEEGIVEEEEIIGQVELEISEDELIEFGELEANLEITGNVIDESEIDANEVNLNIVQENIGELEEVSLEKIEEIASIELEKGEFKIEVDETAEEVQSGNVEYKWGYRVKLKDFNFIAKIDVSSDLGVFIFDETTLRIGNQLLNFQDLVDEGYIISFDKPILGVNNVEEEIEAVEEVIVENNENNIEESFVIEIDETEEIFGNELIEEEFSCAGVGERIFSNSEFGQIDCCDGLKIKPITYEIEEGCTQSNDYSIGICVNEWNCGDDECGNGESECNCPSDCKVQCDQTGYGCLEERGFLSTIGAIGLFARFAGIFAEFAGVVTGESDDFEYLNQITIYIERDFTDSGYQLGDTVILDPTLKIINVEDEANLILKGTSMNKQFGYDVAMGDFNGDGYDDALVTATAGSLGYPGMAYLYLSYKNGSFLDTQADVTFSSTTNSWFGKSVVMGDYNNDGKDDVVLSDYSIDQGQGRVYIYLGHNVLNPETLVITDADVTIDSTINQAYFGYDLAIGNFDGDDYEDVLITTSGSSGNLNAYISYLYYGHQISLKEFISDSSADVKFQVSGYKWNNAVMGDFNGDGKDDVVMQSLWNNGNNRVSVIYGRNKYFGQISDIDLDILGTHVNSYFGESIAIGDYNNDGKGDVAIGSPKWPSNVGDINRGRVSLFYGGTQTGSLDGEKFDKRFYGTTINQQMGASLVMGDYDGDGDDEIITGAPYWNNNLGRVYGFYGESGSSKNFNDDDAEVIFDVDTSHIYLGSSVAIGDFNDEDSGNGDILIGARRFSVDSTNQGNAYLFFTGNGEGPYHGPVTEINSCRTLSESGVYTQVANIIDSSPLTPCITISVRGVTFDGNGYTISGGGILSDQPDTTIQDVDITVSSERAIQFGSEAYNCIVEDSVINSEREGIYLDGTDDCIIRNNIVDSRDRPSLYLINNADHNNILDNNLFSHSHRALYIINGFRETIQGNSINRQLTTPSIVFEGVTESQVELNDFKCEGNYVGIIQKSSNNNIFERNTFETNSAVASHSPLYFNDNANDNTLLNNVLIGPGRGLFLRNSHRMIIEGLDVSSTYGIWLSNSGNNNIKNCIRVSGSIDDVHVQYLTGSTTNTILNCTYDREVVESGAFDARIVRKWYYNARVTDGSVPIQGARVNVSHRWNNSVFNLQTDSQGNIFQQEIVEYVQNGPVITKYSPYRTEASNVGYPDDVHNNIDLKGNLYEEFVLGSGDTTSPIVEITSIGGDNSLPYSTNDLTPTIIATTNEIANCRASLFNKSYEDMVNFMDIDCTGNTDQVCTFTQSVGQTSSLNFYVACNDSSGNQNTRNNNAHAIAEIDTNSPLQSNHNPVSGFILDSTSQIITFNTNEHARCRWSLSDQSYSSISVGNTCDIGFSLSHSCPVSGMLEGSELVYLACTDDTESIPNEDSPATNTQLGYTIVTDLIPPVPTIITIGGDSVLPFSTSDYTTLLIVSTDENADCRASLEDKSYDNMNGSNDISCSGDLIHNCDFNYFVGYSSAKEFYVSCVDNFGNKNTILNNGQAVAEIDAGVPSKSNFNPPYWANVFSTAINITFNTDELASCRASLTKESYDGMIDDFDCVGDWSMSHSCYVSELTIGTDYVYVACTDDTDSVPNNDTISSNSMSELRYNVALDPTPPVINIVYPEDYANSSDYWLNINYTVSDNVAIDSCWYSKDTLAINNTLLDCRNITSISWSGGDHFVVVWANDTSGNKASKIVRFKIDAISPIVTNIVTNPILPIENEGTEEDISINFDSSEYPVNLVFNLYDSGGILVDTQGPLVINDPSYLPINYTIPSGLFEGVYTLNMTFTDPAGNSNTTEVGSFTVSSTQVTGCRKLTEPNTVYTQTQNIEDNSLSGPCIEITASNITFNGDGYWIKSINNEEGVYAYHQSNVTVRNVNISMGVASGGYGIRIHGFSSNNCLIENNFLQDSYYGLMIASMNHCIVRNNLISNSALGSRSALFLSLVNETEVTDNEFYSKNDHAALIQNSENLFFRGNQGISDSPYSSHAGFQFSVVNDLYFMNNLAQCSDCPGLRSLYSSKSEFINNSFSGSYGVYSYDTSESIFESNNYLADGLFGLFLMKSHQNNFTYSNISSSYVGIYLAESANNTFRDSINLHGDTYTIYVTSSFGSVNNVFVNTTYPVNDLIAGLSNSLIRKWYYQARVLDSGSPVQNAVVNAYNKSGHLQFSDLSDVDGWIKQQEIIDYVNLGSNTVYYSDYIIDATSNNKFDEHIYNVTIEQNKLDNLFELNPTKIDAPSNLTIYVDSLGNAKLNWTQIDEAQGYKIWYDTNVTKILQMDSNLVGSVSDANVTLNGNTNLEWIDTEANNYQQRYYAVAAYNRDMMNVTIDKVGKYEITINDEEGIGHTLISFPLEQTISLVDALPFPNGSLGFPATIKMINEAENNQLNTYNFIPGPNFWIPFTPVPVLEFGKGYYLDYFGLNSGELQFITNYGRVPTGNITQYINDEAGIGHTYLGWTSLNSVAIPDLFSFPEGYSGFPATVKMINNDANNQLLTYNFISGPNFWIPFSPVGTFEPANGYYLDYFDLKNGGIQNITYERNPH